MEMQIVNWLKRKYKESCRDGPDAKRVRYSDLSEDIHHQFPWVSRMHIQKALDTAFPKHSKERIGSSRATYVVGIDVSRQQDELHVPSVDQCSSSSPDLEALLRVERVKCAELQAYTRQLEDRLNELESQRPKLLDEVDRVSHQNSVLSRGPDSIDTVKSFSLDSILSELKDKAPQLLHLLSELGETERIDSTFSEMKAVTSACMLLNARSSHCNGFQLLMGMMLIARATDRKIMTILNHAGVCTSYTTTWRHLLRLTDEAHYTHKVRTGHWMWIFDNLNFHNKVRHERQDVHSNMLNVTSRLAVPILNMPSWDVDWKDTKPQRPRSTLTSIDILPSAHDGEVLRARATVYTQQFLVNEFPSLHTLRKFAPQDSSPHPTVTGSAVPLKILFLDEKYIKNVILILEQFYKDADMDGSDQVIIGDQLTCKTIRGAKRWRVSERTRGPSLTWAREVPGDFHFLWECLKVIFDMFWGSLSSVGSLCNLREFIRRVQVDKTVKRFNVGDEFAVHVFKAHFISKICSHLKISAPTDNVDHSASAEWLTRTAQAIVADVLCPSADDSGDSLSSRMVQTLFLYVDLRNAIRYENGEHIIRHWRWWIPRFLSTGKKNYATESATQIINIMANYPKHISHIVVHNRTVNMSGKLGRGKPLDQLLEHYNLVMKLALSTSGPNVTAKHIEEVSLSALFLMDTAKRVGEMFNVHTQNAHTTRDSTKDVCEMATHIADNADETPIEDPCSLGWKKISDGWLEKIIQSGVDSEENSDEVEDCDIENDLDYELSDTV